MKEERKRSYLEIDRDTGIVLSERHCLNNRPDRPESEGAAYIDRDEKTGLVIFERYARNGRWHRENGPAITLRDESGQIIQEEYIVDGRSHRDPNEGPAFIRYSNSDPTVLISEEYYLFGLPYRHPDAGPWYISRNDTGKVVAERFCKPEDLFDPRRPPSLRARPQRDGRASARKFNFG